MLEQFEEASKKYTHSNRNYSAVTLFEESIVHTTNSKTISELAVKKFKEAIRLDPGLIRCEAKVISAELEELVVMITMLNESNNPEIIGSIFTDEEIFDKLANYVALLPEKSIKDLDDEYFDRYNKKMRTITVYSER